MNISTYKIIIIGDCTVGKSSIINYYMNDSFHIHYNSTIGIDFKSKTTNIDGKNVKLQIWDTAGQERFRSIIRSYYRSCDGAIVVFDVTAPYTLENINNWLNEINNYMMSNCPIILVGNKIDLCENNQVSYNTKKNVNSILESNTNITYIETSAKTGIMINDIFISLAKKLLNNVNSHNVNNKYITFCENTQKTEQKTNCYC